MFKTWSKDLYCEDQGKGKARARPRNVTQRSFMDGGWWMVDIRVLLIWEIQRFCNIPFNSGLDLPL